MKHQHQPQLLLLLAVLTVTVFSCKPAPYSVHHSAINIDSAYARPIVAQYPDVSDQHDSLVLISPEVLDSLRSQQESQNMLLNKRSRFTTGGVAMILGIGTILVFLVLNSRWNRKLQIKNMELQRERNVVVAQNKQLAIERDHAEAASRAKTAFIQSMTHEIRTPLNAINGFTQVLTMKDIELPDADRIDFCERIQDNTRMLTAILDNLILIADLESRSELPAPEPCVISAVAMQAVDIVRPIVAKTVILDCLCDLPFDQTIDSYPRMIHTILSQLLENAAKFTTVGSIKLHLSRQESMLRFSVIDTGPGIPPDKKEYIFERFTKLDSFAQGTGLGLAVARMIAERLGGTLTLDTAYTSGSKFDFLLPVSNISIS